MDANPGMPEVRKHWGLYYYYHTMAKCLDTLGLDKVKDAAGKEHDWRADITAALAKRQNEDGSWRNDNAPLDGGRSAPRHRLRAHGPEPL